MGSVGCRADSRQNLALNNTRIDIHDCAMGLNQVFTKIVVDTFEAPNTPILQLAKAHATRTGGLRGTVTT